MSFFAILMKCSLLVSIEMLIILVMGAINRSRQFFSTLVEMESRSHDFDDELKISFLISSSVARSETFILDLISVFFAHMENSVLYLKMYALLLSNDFKGSL